MFFSDVNTEMSVLFCQYDLGFDPFLVGNGFHYFYFCFILLTLFVICELYIYIFFIDFYNPRINKVINKVLRPTRPTCEDVSLLYQMMSNRYFESMTFFESINAKSKIGNRGTMRENTRGGCRNAGGDMPRHSGGRWEAVTGLGRHKVGGREG